MPILPTMNGNFKAPGINGAFRVSTNSTSATPQLFTLQPTLHVAVNLLEQKQVLESEFSTLLNHPQRFTDHFTLVFSVGDFVEAQVAYGSIKILIFKRQF